MENSESESYFVAELKVGENKAKVELFDITMKSCMAKTKYGIRPYQKGMLQIHSYQNNQLLSSFKPAKVVAESIKQKTGEVDTFYVKLKFNGMVSASQGIVQLLHSTIYEPPDSKEPDKKSKNNALNIELVTCPFCEEENIPFRTLERRSMKSKTNIFGVTKYLQAYPGKDFCDFNLIRIAVCPVCYFASNDVQNFVRTMGNGDVKTASFDASEISAHWLDTSDERKRLLGDCLNDFFNEDRSLEQAILSYQLAVISSDRMFEMGERRGPRLRNYNPARKSLFYLFIIAELFMCDAQENEAEDVLNEIIRRLESIFPYLTHESSIRSAYLLGMLNIYFEDYRQAGKYLTFLRRYNKKDTVKSGTNEYSELLSNLRKLNEVYQSRNEFGRSSLNGFDRPY